MFFIRPTYHVNASENTESFAYILVKKDYSLDQRVKIMLSAENLVLPRRAE
jgi:hypothetical protein